MIETKFWSPANSSPNAKSAFGSQSKYAGLKDNRLIKGLGVSTGVVLAITASLLVLFYLTIVKPAQALVQSVTAVKLDVKSMENALKERDLIALEAAFIQTEKDLNNLRKERDEKFGWAKNFGPVKNYYSDSDRFVNAGLYAIDAGREVVNLVRPFADAAGLKVSQEQEVEQTDSLLEAFSTWIAVMPQVADDSDVFLAKLAKVGDELEHIDTTKYPESFRGTPIRSNIELVKNTLAQVNDYAPDIKASLIVIPKLLGVGTPEKRYMVIMQNDKEIRATGGFWTNYATFKIKDGLLSSDFTSKDMYSVDLTLDAIDAYFTFPKAPESYQKYLKVERMYARDANISPDFPTSIDQFMYFYKLGQRISPAELKAVDGVVAIDTYVIAELLEVTGPATVNGVTYTADNVVLELEKIASLALREQIGRKRVLGDLMERMLINVFESDKNLWPKLVDKGIDLAMRKHIVGYSFDPEAQALLEKYNLAGRIVDPVDGDFSYVVSTNLGGDKTNWFTTKQVDHVLTREGDKYVDTVKIKYTYSNPDGIYAPFIKRFRDWVRVFAPAGSQIIDVTGSQDGYASAEERNKTYFTGYVELGPGESTELTYKYTLAEGVVKNGVYKLYIQKQPGIDKEIHTVTVGGKTDKIELEKDYMYTKKL